MERDILVEAVVEDMLNEAALPALPTLTASPPVVPVAVAKSASGEHVHPVDSPSSVMLE